MIKAIAFFRGLNFAPLILHKLEGFFYFLDFFYDLDFFIYLRKISKTPNYEKNIYNFSINYRI